MPNLPITRYLSYRKRPLYAIQVHNGNVNDGNGLVSQWGWDNASPVADKTAVETLIANLDMAYNIGYRDFLFHMPAGQSPENTFYYGGSHWYTIPESRRQVLSESLKEWIASKKADNPENGFTFGIYISIPARDDYDLTQLSLEPLDKIHLPEPDKDSGDKSWVDGQVEGWLEIGINRVWFDAASSLDAQPHFEGRNIDVLFDGALIQKEYLERIHNLHTGGEALVTDGTNNWAIDEKYSSVMPWMAVSDWIDIYDRLTSTSLSFNFDYNATTRICTITTPSFSLSAQGYSDFVAGDNLKIGYHPSIPTSRYIIEERINNTSFKLSTESIVEGLSAILPVSNITGLTGGTFYRPGLISSTWNAPKNTDELCFLFRPESGYHANIITDFLKNGFRVGVWTFLGTMPDTNTTQGAEKIFDTYMTWIRSNAVTTRIIRRQH